MLHHEELYFFAFTEYSRKLEDSGTKISVGKTFSFLLHKTLKQKKKTTRNCIKLTQKKKLKMYWFEGTLSAAESLNVY